MIPRIQGKVGQATDPPEMAGKWFFTIWVSALGGGDEREEYGPIGPWDTEEIAQAELRTATRLVCEKAAEMIPGAIPGKYVDMKTNTTRRWDKADEH